MSETATVEAEPEVAVPQTLNEAVLAVQAEALDLDLRRDGQAKEKSKRTGDTRTRRYLEYPKLLRQLQPLLTANKLTWMTFPTTTPEGRPALEYELTFVPTGESKGGTMALLLDQQTSQAQGSALTYSRRYALQNVLNLTPDGDDDGEAASAPPRPAPADPEAPLPEASADAMLEAIAERGLSATKVLERAGATNETLTIGDSRKVKAILDAHDAAQGES
jgi:hypothetical protein